MSKPSPVQREHAKQVASLIEYAFNEVFWQWEDRDHAEHIHGRWSRPAISDALRWFEARKLFNLVSLLTDALFWRPPV